MQLLADARAQRTIGSLVSPPGANAAESYFNLLQRESDNRDALAGLDEVLGSAADSLVGEVPSAKRGEIEARFAAIDDYARRTALADDSAFGQQRIRLAQASLERARESIDAYQRDEAIAWLAFAATVSARDAAWSATDDAARALVQAGAAISDAGGPPLRAVPPRVGGSRIATALFVMRDEVTRGDYARFAESTGRAATRCRNRLSPLRMFDRRDWRNPGFQQGASEPVVCVSYDDAQAYARWLGTRTGQRYTLPTLAQWRHSAQIGSSRATCARGNVLDASASGTSRHACNDGAAHTAAAGRFVANAFGINDLLGNVSEWTLDCSASTGANAQQRCARRNVIGYSWRDGPSADMQGLLDADRGYDDVGFRLVREP